MLLSNKKVLGIFLSLGVFLTFGVFVSAKGESRFYSQKEESGEIETNPVRKFSFGVDLKKFSKEKLDAIDVATFYVAFYYRFSELLKNSGLKELENDGRCFLFFLIMDKFEGMSLEKLKKKFKELYFGSVFRDEKIKKFAKILESGEANNINLTKDGFKKFYNKVKTKLKNILNGLNELNEVFVKYIDKKNISDKEYKEVCRRIFDIGYKEEKSSLTNKQLKDIKTLRQRIEKKPLLIREIVKSILNKENMECSKIMAGVVRKNLELVEKVNIDKALKISKGMIFERNLSDITKKFLRNGEKKREADFENLFALIDINEKMNFCDMHV